MRKELTILLFSFMLLYPLTAIAQDYRDVVFMKNGSVIKGFYKDFYPGDSLRMETIDGGVFICAVKDIERIAKERTSIYVTNIQDEDLLPKRAWRPAGAKGYVEYGHDINGSDQNLVGYSLIVGAGYQFGHHVYFGGGIAMTRYEYEANNLKLVTTNNSLPLFAEFQYNLLRTRITPILGCRAGYTVKGFKGFYFNPSVSVDFGLTPRLGGYILVGYSLQNYNDEDVSRKAEGLSLHIGLHF